MLLGEVNNWSPHCYATVRTGEVMALYMPAGIQLLQKRGNTSDHYTIIQTLHYVHCHMLLQCASTELQPVVTELMVG